LEAEINYESPGPEGHPSGTDFGGPAGTSKIGLGCVTFGREINKDDSFALMDYAYAHGIRHFDTAAAYSSGASEQIVGQWLTSRRPSDITIATKLLPPFTNIDASLQRLSRIDILYLHRWDEKIPVEIFEKGIKIGASNFTAAQVKGLPFQYIQNNHNLAVSDLTDELKNHCIENNIKIVTYSPLGAGFLTGKHAQGVQPGSRFDIMPGHQQVYFNGHAQQRLKKLQEVSDRTGHSMVHLALAWALHQPVTTVLIGGRTPAHLDQALEALSFNDSVLEELTSPPSASH
jgi:aryl-alcohol dehydrogenase-like predicted oxidoreductase